MSDELRTSLMDLAPEQMRERAIDYMLMAEKVNSKQARETFLRVAARLQELARELERRETSSPHTAAATPDAACRDPQGSRSGSWEAPD